MSEALKSNILISTKVTSKRKGFREIHSSITKLETRLKALTKTPWTIKLNFKTNKPELLAALQEVGKQAEAASKKLAKAKQAGMAPGQKNPPLVLPGGQNVLGSKRIASNFDEKGRPGRVTAETVEKEISGTMEKQKTTVNELKGAKRGVKSITEEQVNLEKELELKAQRKAAQLNKAVQLRKQELNLARQAFDREVADLKSMGMKETSRASQIKQVVPGSASLGDKGMHVSETREYRKQLSATHDMVSKVNSETGRSTHTIQKNTERIRQQTQEIKREVAARKKKADALIRERRLQREAEAKAQHASEIRSSLSGQGFTQMDPKFIQQMDGTTNRIDRFYKVARTGLAAYEVQMSQVNSTTGEMITRTLRGAEAAKFLGDSMFRAAEKVLMWTVSTSVIFGTIRAIRSLVSETRKLEKNTVFLARVGEELEGVTLDQKIKSAKELTTEITKLTAGIGGLATEAQEAAAVFLRTGQTAEETLISVKAALLAAKIAELEVLDAAQLLSSALLQFDLKARDLLPTLNSLNSLSNNYRVTTDDLLQSISRSGSVIAEHNGKLTELAAATAVVSEVTSRTGTQIGNAFKTIQSRMDRIEVRKSLFKDASISTVNFEGESKSLVETLLELQMAMDAMNETQQKNVGLQAAGIRQRNIFNAALNNAHEILIANNKALLDSSSANEEFDATAKTLDLSLERLRGTISEVVNSLSDGVGAPLKVMTNLAIAILKVINVLDGLPLKIALSVAGFYAMRRALMGAVSGWSILTAKVNENTAANAANAASTAGLTKSLIGMVGKMNVATIVVGAISLGLSYLIQRQTTYNQALDDGLESVNNDISAHKKRLEAIRATTAALVKMAVEMENLKSKGDEDRAEKIEKRAVAIGASLSFNSRDPGINFYGGDIGKIIEQSAARQKKEAEDLIKKHRLSLDILKQKKRDQAPEVGSARRAVIREETMLPIFYFDREAHEKKMTKLKAELAAEQQKYNKLTEEEKEHRKAIAELEKISTVNNADKIRQEKEAAKLRFETLNAMFKRESDLPAAMGGRRVAGTDGSLSVMKRDLDEVNKLYRDLDESISMYQDSLTESNAADVLAEDFKKLTKYQQEAVELFLRIEEVTKNQRAGFFEDRLSRQSSMREKLREIQVEKYMDQNETPSHLRDIAKINIRRDAALDQISSADLMLREDSLIGKKTDPAKAEAAKKNMLEELVKLRDLEAEKAMAILKAEKDIAEARKKSADEAQRALGALSEEDKLRLRAQASFFQRNPNAKISAQDQFLASSDSNNILNRFFAGRAGKFDPATDPFARSLTNAGFGSDPSLDEASKMIRKMKGGRTDEQVANNALARQEQIDRQIRGIQEGRQVNELSFAGSGITHGEAGNARGDGVRVNVGDDTFDLSPLVDSFEKVLTDVVRSEAERVTEEARRRLETKSRRPDTGGAAD